MLIADADYMWRTLDLTFMPDWYIMPEVPTLLLLSLTLPLPPL